MIAYIGVDPGTIRAGIAVILDDGGEPRVSAVDAVNLPGLYTATKCATLASAIRDTIRDARLAGASSIRVAIERPFSDRNWDSYGKLCRAVGALAAGALLDCADVVVTEADNRRVKHGITNNSNASKEQIARAVIGRFALQCVVADICGEGADALAVAAWLRDRSTTPER